MKIISRKHAIDEHCKECIYDRISPGTWREQVENCTSPLCNLYTYRPLTQATLEKIKEEKYEKMSPIEKLKADKKAEEVRKRFSIGKE